jgi:AraC-like DNA-binding protein
VLYTPELEAAAYFGESQEFLTFHLHFPVQLLHYYRGIFPALSEFIGDIESAKPVLLFEQAGWLTSEMLRGINNLGDLPRGKESGEYFLDIKVKDLLFNLLVQKYHRGTKTINDKNLESIRNVRHIVEAHMGKIISIGKIAKMTGMNVHTLKKTFKQVVGIGLADFILKARMNNALFLLREQSDMPIKRIAWLVGYDHEENFITAFKKHFGITPKIVRQNEMRWP